MHGTKIIGGLFAILAASDLLLTGWIMHRSGALQGATEDGRWALGLAAILVHLIIAVCGLAMFVSKNRKVSAVCCLMMLGAAACSAWQIATFLATEVISVSMAREQAEKREAARTTAALEMAKERQRTQAQLLKDELKWSRGTSREVDGRRERKDLAETRAKMIAEAGKADAPIALPPAKTEVPTLQSGKLAQWLAAKLGYDETALQASPYLLIALMLLLAEVAFWPLASWFWNRPPTVMIHAYAVPPAPVPSAPAAAFLAPPKSEAPQMGGNAHISSPPVGLPPPHVEAGISLPERQAKQPKLLPPPRGRQPVSEAARKALDDAGYPWIKPRGPLLEQKLEAEPFAVWLRAFGYDGSHDLHEIRRLYEQACKEFHREELTYRTLAAELDNRRLGVVKKSGGPVVWVVSPFRPKKEAKAPVETTEQPEQRADSEPEEGGVVTRPPFGVAPVRRNAMARMVRLNFRELNIEGQRQMARMEKAEWQLIRRRHAFRRRAAA